MRDFAEASASGSWQLSVTLSKGFLGTTCRGYGTSCSRNYAIASPQGCPDSPGSCAPHSAKTEVARTAATRIASTIGALDRTVSRLWYPLSLPPNNLLLEMGFCRRKARVVVFYTTLRRVFRWHCLQADIIQPWLSECCLLRPPPNTFSSPTAAAMPRRCDPAGRRDVRYGPKKSRAIRLMDPRKSSHRASV